jgi:PAS domain S-box-containing protein
MISNKFLIKFIGIFCISISSLSILHNYITAIHLDILGMDLTTAIAFLLSGIAFLLLAPVEIAASRKIFGKLMALIVTIISTRELYLGQMAPGSAICFILIGLALFFLHTHESKLQWFSQMCALIGAFITFGGIMTELYGIHDLTGIFTLEKISFPRIRVLLFLLSYGILMSRPPWKLTEVFFSPFLGGKYLRKLLPTIMVTLIVFGLAGLLGEFIGFVPISGTVIFQLLAMLVFFYIMWKSAVNLDRIDRAHKAELEKRLDYEKLFNLSFDMICIASSDGYFKYLNAAFERILGFSKEELLDKSFTEFVHPDDRAKTKAEIIKLTRGKVTSTYMENRYVCKDGSYKLLGWTSAWAEKEGIIFAVARDLTNVKKSEEDLRSAYDFVEAILDNVPNMIFVKDAKELRFLRLNKAGEQLLGYTRQELLGKNDYDFFPKEQADFFSAKDRVVLSGKAIIEIMEEPIQTMHQGERILRTKKIPIYDLQGHPQYLLGISEDITDFKRLNEERERTEIILRSAERINSLIQNSLDAVVGMNDEGLVISWNSQAEKIFNWNKEEAIGRPLADLIIPSRFRLAHRQGIKTFLKTGVGPILNNRIELIGLRRGEVEFPLELAVTPHTRKSQMAILCFCP